MKPALRFLAALVCAFVALYLLFLLPAPLLLDVVEWTTAIEVDAAWEHPVALLGASVGATLYAIRDARSHRSLERLWTFVLGAHLFTYLLVFPFFHLTDVRTIVVSEPASRVVYYATGYGLFVVALAVAYALVYRDGVDAAVRRLTT